MSVRQRSFGKEMTRSFWRTLRRFLHNRGTGTRGVAAIEFAAIATMLVFMMVGGVDFGAGFYRRMEVQNAAQAGAQYAISCASNPSCTFSASDAQKAVTQATGLAGILATPAPVRFDGCATSTGITAPDVNYKCPDGSTAATYVTASAQAVYNTILPFPLLGIPGSFTFSAQSTVRVQ